ncbi:hypothetical protein A9Q86_12200 [Flavobacteriales bacterium 33_180_T64]|nr:hypothetical protein A9Q86_12200 [Flavobacteriales bacterium 33_180_T64]
MFQELINISFDNYFGVPFWVALSAVALFKELQQLPQSLTQSAKLSKSLYKPTFTSTFVQILYQYVLLSLLTVKAFIIPQLYEIRNH